MRAHIPYILLEKTDIAPTTLPLWHIPLSAALIQEVHLLTLYTCKLGGFTVCTKCLCGCNESVRTNTLRNS